MMMNHGFPAMDHVFEVMGKADPFSTVERKYEEKQKKLSYGQELQMQMQQQKMQKQFEANEHRGVGPEFGGQPGGSPIGPYGPSSPGGGFGGGVSPSPFQQPHMASPAFQPAFMPRFQPPPMPQPSYQPSFQPMGLANFQPPQPYQRGLSFVAPIPALMQHFQPMDYGRGFVRPPAMGGGFVAPPPQQMPPQMPPQGLGPATMQRFQQKEQKDQYRLELEAQMREKADRLDQEKRKIMEQDRLLEMHGRGGGGNGQQGFQNNNAPPAYAPPQAFAQQFQPQFNGGGGGGPVGGSPQGGRGLPDQGGGGGNVPHFNFRSDNAYMTPADMDDKARQKAELQRALQAQIDEKKAAKKREQDKEAQDLAVYDGRLQREQEHMREQFQAEQNGGQSKDPKDVVADAWEKARQDVEDSKKAKYAAKRGAGGGGGGGGGVQDNRDGQGMAAPPPPPPPSFMDAPAPVQHQPRSMQSMNGMPSTPMVEAKVRQVAQREIERVRHEMAAEAAGLREVVESQAQQVAALRTHAERLESEAAQAKVDMQRLRISSMHQGADRHIPGASPHKPLVMHDIALDLPPPAAVLRRSAMTHIDMGPLLAPVANPAAIMHSAAMNVIDQQSRPPTMGMRLVDPLEESMAAESTLIYPNGREMRIGQPKPPLVPAPPSPLGPATSLQPILEQDELPTSPTKEVLPIIQPAPVVTPSKEPAAAVPLFGRRADLAAAAGRPPAGVARPTIPPTPLDMGNLEYKNRDKLAVLQGLTKLDADASLEAMDTFLTQFSRSKPAVSERTATPNLRVNTPIINTASIAASIPRPSRRSTPSAVVLSVVTDPTAPPPAMARPVSTSFLASDYKSSATPMAPTADLSRAQSANSATGGGGGGRSQVFQVQHSLREGDSLDFEMMRAAQPPVQQLPPSLVVPSSRPSTNMGAAGRTAAPGPTQPMPMSGMIPRTPIARTPLPSTAQQAPQQPGSVAAAATAGAATKANGDGSSINENFAGGSVVGGSGGSFVGRRPRAGRSSQAPGGKAVGEVSLSSTDNF